MAMVTLNITGRSYQVACKDGEEETLRAAARLVDAKSREAVSGMGTLSEARQFLFAALMLADTLVDNRPEAAAPPPPDPALAKGPSSPAWTTADFPRRSIVPSAP